MFKMKRNIKVYIECVDEKINMFLYSDWIETSKLHHLISSNIKQIILLNTIKYFY